MRVAVTLFLFLCFHLAGRSGAGYAALHESKTCFLPGSIGRSGHTVQLTSLKQDGTVAESSNEENSEFLGIEDDDEDEIEVFARKKFRFDRCLSVFFDALLSRLSSGNSPVQAPFFNSLLYNDSCLYLTQKALRI